MSTAVHFTLLDYIFFAIVFVVSIAIGLYYAFKAKKEQHSVNEYFFGGKKLGVLPMAFSLLASAISGSMIIGQSMEVYAYGLHTVMYLVIILALGIITPIYFLPIFYELQLMSSFSYLELRFDSSVKHLASALYVISGFIYMPFTIYVPALAFEEVSGINFYVIYFVSGYLCICYSTMGGFKAVVWTDAFQFILIISSILVILSVGLVNVGGFQNVWDALDRGGRLQFFRTDFNLETRGSLWAYLSSISLLTFYNLCLNQSNIQRYLSLPTFKKAKLAFYIQHFFINVIFILQFIIGAIIYASYEGCDPMVAGIVKRIDQIFPYFVQEKASLFPGFNGIFIAGIFSAGLSSTSTFLNTLSGTIYMDFLNSRLTNVSEKAKSKIMRILVVLVGVIGLSVIFLIERLGTIFAINIITLTSTTVGVFGLFCSGFLFRNINSKGAKCGAVVGIVVAIILILGGLNKNPDPVLPLRTDECYLVNSTNISDFVWKNATDSLADSKLKDNQDLPWFFRINFQFFSIIGLVINIFVGSIVSFATGGNTIEDERLLVKFVRKNVHRETLLRPN